MTQSYRLHNTAHKRLQHHTSILQRNNTSNTNHTIRSHTGVKYTPPPQKCVYDNSKQLWLLNDTHNELVQLDGKLTRDQALQCIEYLNQYHIEVFEYSNKWNVIHRACDICSNNILIHVCIADYYIARQDAQSAKDRIYIAQQCITSYTTQRELYYLDAFTKWLSGQVPAAYAVLQECLNGYPNDLFIGKKAQLLAFLMVFINLCLLNRSKSLH